MKCNFFIASAVAVLALVGCNKETPKNEAALNSSQKEITFSPYFGRALTKAANGADLGGNIKVSSMPVQTLNNTSFSYWEDGYYKPADGQKIYWAEPSYRFLAVHPDSYSITVSDDPEKGAQAGINVTDFAGGKDIKVANTGVVTSPSTTSSTSTNLTFSHAVNSIEVYAKLEKKLAAGEEIKITQIELNNCYQSGLCSFLVGDDKATGFEWKGTENAAAMTIYKGDGVPVESATTPVKIGDILYIIPDGSDLSSKTKKEMRIDYNFIGDGISYPGSFTGKISTDVTSLTGQKIRIDLTVKGLDEVKFACDTVAWTPNNPALEE